MEYTENYNLKKPDMNDTALISDINENMDIIDQKLKEASQNEQLQSDVTEIKNDIGSTEDLSTSPTIFGKLAELKEILTTKFADIISKITSIDSKIGTTTDTGGTSSAGGIFAKLNKLLTDWTTTRASRIDSIYTNTNTSTTSSSTGTLCQRLNYIRTLIGTSSDSGTSTVFGLLNALSSKGVVKSKQTGVVLLKQTSETTDGYIPDARYVDISIATVNINKSIVIVSTLLTKELIGRIINSNTLRIYIMNGNTVINHTHWEILEFY